MTPGETNFGNVLHWTSPFLLYCKRKVFLSMGLPVECPCSTVFTVGKLHETLTIGSDCIDDQQCNTLGPDHRWPTGLLNFDVGGG